MPIRNAATQTISQMTSIERRAQEAWRRTTEAVGHGCQVVRIAPDVYSLVMKSAPITPTANSAKMTPTRLVDTGQR